MKCRFHINCEQPCKIEAALHAEIQASPVTNPKRLAALRRGGRAGGQKRLEDGKFVKPVKKLLTLVPPPVTSNDPTSTSTESDSSATLLQVV